MRGFICIVLSVFSFSAPAVEAELWRTHMQSLSATLIDAFPYFYSSSEFREKKKNEKRILKSLETLAANAHALPAQAGEVWIGAEPLIADSQTGIQKKLKEAADLYKQGRFEDSQKLVHGAINRCFACHTAHQVGPNFPASNSEIMGMASPFTMGKAVVFGALRQFDGALTLIENTTGYAVPRKVGNVSLSRENPEANELVKLYMVVALRAQQNFPRALNYLDRLLKDNEKHAALNRWRSDILAWQNGKPSGAGEGDIQFIANLRESLTLHKQVADKKTTPQAKKAVYTKLAAAYRALGFAPLSDLAEVYAEKAK